jgi:hypothetical protein
MFQQQVKLIKIGEIIMRLEELIEYLKYEDLINFKSVEISGISYNSQTTKKRRYLYLFSRGKY